MNKYFYDSFAIIELLKGNEKYSRYFSEYGGITSFHNANEVYYIMLREEGEEKAETALNFLRQITTHLDFDIIEESMKFRYKNKKSKFSYADCLGYIAARKNNLIFLTGDSGFKNFPNVDFIERKK